MNNRPKIKIPLTTFDIIIEVLSVIALAFIIVLTAYVWSKLPARIPTHFNAAGQIDGYGGKSTLLILTPIIFVLYVGLTILSKFPHVYNYTVEITDKNAEMQYKIAVRLMRLGILILPFYILYNALIFTIYPFILRYKIIKNQLPEGATINEKQKNIRNTSFG